MTMSHTWIFSAAGSLIILTKGQIILPLSKMLCHAIVSCLKTAITFPHSSLLADDFVSCFTKNSIRKSSNFHILHHRIFQSYCVSRQGRGSWEKKNQAWLSWQERSRFLAYAILGSKPGQMLVLKQVSVINDLKETKECRNKWQTNGCKARAVTIGKIIYQL